MVRRTQLDLPGKLTFFGVHAARLTSRRGHGSVRCEICGEGERTNGLPDQLCWDSTASPDEVHEWARRVDVNANDPAKRYLGSIGSPQAAEALRHHLASDNDDVLALVVSSLGWSGNEADGPSLISLIDHPAQKVRIRAMESLAELGVEAAIEPLSSRLAQVDLDERERARLIECLAWLRYPGVLSELREMLGREGASHLVNQRSVADSLVRVGDSSDRAEIARMAVERLERSAAAGYVERPYERAKEWHTYRGTVGAVAPDEAKAVEESLSEAARLALTAHPYGATTPDESETSLGPLEVPRRSIAGFTDSRPAGEDGPPAKFFGQPDWRETPSWPISDDGQPLTFYGQLSIDDNRTAYLFLNAFDDGEALGPSTALVIQPGGECHLPTVERAEGPHSFDLVTEEGRFVKRTRRLPRTEQFVVWSDGADPEEFPPGAPTVSEHWNKVGGTPLYLQGDDSPGEGWAHAFQVSSGLTGHNVADNAMIYGWVNEAGQGALGWQSH
jgi:HEAT repeats